MASLSFPSPTQLKNISDPSIASDAATKAYVDAQISGGSVGASGSNTQVQFNNAGTLGASANFTFNTSTNLLTVTGNIASTNANVGNLTVTGNASFTGANVSLGNVANLHITGGTADYVLKTDGAGNLSWTAQSTGTLIADVDAFTGDGTTSSFTLANTPAGENFTMVAVQGVLQPKTTYSLSGNVLTFTSAPPSTAIVEVTTFGGAVAAGGGTSLPSQTGNSGKYLTTNGTSASWATVSSGSSFTWNIASSNATMSANNGYFVDTSSGAKTMTLPTSATLGDTIRINDLAGSFATYNLTVARNGHKIQGIADDLLVDANQSSFGLVYSNSTYGWKVLEL
jgi:hypothetical protein